MRNFIIGIIALFIATSCETECQTCTTFGVEETICESDFSTNQEYQDAIASAETQGFCNAN